MQENIIPKMAADSSNMSDSGDEDDPRSLAHIHQMPVHIIEKFQRMGLPSKMMKRMIFLGEREELDEFLEFENKQSKRDHYSSGSSRSSSVSENAEYNCGWAVTPQSQPMDDRQKRNKAGGYVYQVDDETRVRRFLCLGTANGTYYTKEKEHTKDNTDVITKMMEEHKGDDVIKVLLDFKGRVAKQNTTLLILAMCARQGKDLKAKRAAYKALPELCGTPTQLFQFLEYYNNMKQDGDGSGWGRAHRIGVANWYLSYKDKPSKLAMQLTKYRQRNGWTHKDVLRLSHVKPQSERSSEALAVVLKYTVKGLEKVKEGMEDDANDEIKKIVEYLEAADKAKSLPANKIDEAVELIQKHKLVREHLPTEMLNSIPIWKALLKTMPVFAMIRNLGKMTSMALLDHGSEEASFVGEKLTNHQALKYAKVHPFNVLVAHKVYAKGHGDLGKLSWNPNPGITMSLESAFYKSFKYVEPTNKRFLIALDISSSMKYGTVNGCNMTPSEAAAAMAMVTARTETNHTIIGFGTNMIKLGITAENTLQEVQTIMHQQGFGGTDCSQPMIYAETNRLPVDVFIVYTDNETWHGQSHPPQALRRYRASSGILDAKLIVVAFTSTEFSIADPNDRHMLDVVGFDSSAPEVMRNFILNKI